MFLYNWMSVVVLGHTRFNGVRSLQECKVLSNGRQTPSTFFNLEKHETLTFSELIN